ncbi:MAG: 4-hydroxythreonine-4-phosphate dehydrogenase PdxA [Acidiferrobacterales bacterium]|nr:4-hydroxythreonine-4-phosphate dehydrogenase PdxA [Acidiferrobacterales bacterium]
MDRIRVLAYTPGDPAGIGPDLTLQLASQICQHRIVVIADRNVLKERAKLLHVNPALREYDRSQRSTGEIECLHVDCSATVHPGQPDTKYAEYILETLDIAIDGCLSGEFDGLVTGPVGKEIIIRAGTAFTGHTEYLAKKTKTDCPVMLLCCGNLRVALVTTHLPLSKVPKAVTKDRILSVARVLQHDLVNRFQIASPRIGVCGLNPHAGEGGQLGTEEVSEIRPAIKQLQAEGLEISGPYPADTLFTGKMLDRFDVILSMYHDQGLPVVKHAGFGEVVNVTLGLPMVRTSVDHGTAYDIAATGQADAGSLLSAITMAAELSSAVEA